MSTKFNKIVNMKSHLSKYSLIFYRKVLDIETGCKINVNQT